MCGLFDAACAVPGYAPSVLRRFRQEFDAAIYAPEPAAALPQRGRGIAEPAQRTPYFLLLQARRRSQSVGRSGVLADGMA